MQHKQYVDVFVLYKHDGSVIPVSIVWSDGRRYIIDRITDIRRAASLKCGGTGLRYTVIIQGRQRMLFFEDLPEAPKWFIEVQQ